MSDSKGFELLVEPHRVVTAGLAPIDRPELAIEVASLAEIDDAKRLLLRLAGYIVSTNACIVPGDRLDLGGQKLTLTLEDAGLGVLTVRTGRRRRRASRP